MGLYNVIAPCLVNGLHYVNPTKQPIQVDDDKAASLVKAGSLEPYGPSVEHVHVATDHEGTAVGDPDQDPLPTGDFAPADETPRKPRRRNADPEDAA